MAKLNKVRKDGLLQNHAFFREAVFGLFGSGLWYLERYYQAIIRFTITVVGILTIFISQVMYHTSPIQLIIEEDVRTITIIGIVLLAIALLWNAYSLIMIFLGLQKDGKLVKINDWAINEELFVEDNVLKHIDHKTYTIEEIEAGIIDEHYDLRNNHSAHCPKHKTP
ncbi:Uncharacterised protein [Mesomycoplasma conjunctivae]|uniref:Uncharacterized protein n=1 Tax=Mesomycoplasma conjunctivae (strain ATCC 25834 / NCTC 10147 / HRC/581) TaxID=572263 RepID=C5J5J5_MESCH|nr:hypothetical protein [Mesomycoplasma conjunctivae]CAT04718.1 HYPOTHETICAL PROTEIN MCJ_000400 [Mesomycoplasma conjunctivae]VEU65713.1 Uncharacterised protein [Mesomycoplasma conjunctivae]